MNYSKNQFRLLISLVLVIVLVSLVSCNNVSKTGAGTSNIEAAPAWKSWSVTPPMGWNSYDCYGGSINEEQFKKCVDILSEKMLPFGYDYAVIDIAWYEPASINNADIAYYNPVNKENYVTLDEYGRAIPAPDRFPSSVNGVGFKALADYAHSKGMKFGIHIMRGIPRAAVRNKLPIQGSKYTADQVGELYDSCQFWQSDNWGVDYFSPGGQEYYNSIFQLYADWGVDFIKADDMQVPNYHKYEIEMMRNAIDKTGRPMILSLSCGEAQVSFAPHTEKNANMYRISIDIWDKWTDLKRLIELAHYWSPFIGDATWPDADMIPIGQLKVNSPKGGRESMLNDVERHTMMNIWAMMRSPFMWGGDPITSSQADFDMMTNKELIEVMKNSRNNRQIYHRYGRGETNIVWFAETDNPDENYFALFNLADEEQEVKFVFEFEYLRDDKYSVRDLWMHEDLGQFHGEYSKKLPPHGSAIYKLSKIK